MAKVAFTAGRVNGFKCPPDRKQSFLWDATAPGLGLRATPSGKPAYVFQGVFDGKDLRITIGSPTAWSIRDAQEKAREIQRMLDEGHDPRQVKRQQQAEREAERKREQAQSVTVGEVWAAYIEERRPHWGELHYQSHIDKASPGGQPSKRRGMTNKLTTPGPLAPLMPLALNALDAITVEAWAAKEGKTRPSSARLAWRLLSVFLNWCAEHPQYATVVPDRNPAKSRKARESLGKAGVKDDVLTREQLPSWFSAVRQIPNTTISTALQVMLLTGARPGEVLTLRWEDVNTQWRGLTIRDKVEGERTIPLTPYVQHLLATLPRRNDWVFASTKALQMDSHNTRRREAKAAKRGTDAPKGAVLETSQTGYISKPNAAHASACKVAGIDELTLHGLRRSFSSLTEWLEIPAGVVAQIQGHKPSATAEKHYKRRPLDLLRIHHERIEAWMLEQAGVQFAAKAEPDKLRVVA